MTIIHTINTFYHNSDLYIKIGSVCPSVCATISASINHLPRDRLRCCGRYIRCQRSLAVKPLNSRPAMYIALQLLGVRAARGRGCWTVDFDTHVQHYSD